MVIEFGENASASLLVSPTDDPATLAKRFCFENNIDPHVINTLASNIRSLQATAFSGAANQEIRVERNNSSFQGKENIDIENVSYCSRGGSVEKVRQGKRSGLGGSRSKTNQSMVS